MPAAIQGEAGSNSARAARQLLGDGVQLRCCTTFAEVFQALDAGQVARAVLPFENSTAGLIGDVADRLLGLLPGAPLAVIAQLRLPISFVAAALDDSSPVTRVLAHPVAAAQCKRFLSASGWEVLACHDTAGAARLVREQRDPGLAALCPPEAAELYGLYALHRDCGDFVGAVTRFLVLEPGAPRGSPSDDRCFLRVDAVGDLAAVLQAFARSGVSPIALHARPVPPQPLTSRYLIELASGADHDPGRSALAELGSKVRLVATFRNGEGAAR